jgi:glycosyltransferase involved in cell wall biosynthesis
MRFSVIVPAYQAATVLPQCLTALQQQTIDRAQYEIIIVDDGSTDTTAEVAQQGLRTCPEARVIRVEHGGPAQARNTGAQAANGEILLFTDADCAPLPDWIEQFARVFADPGISGAAGAYTTQQRSLIARFVQQEYEERYAYTRRQTAIDFIDTYSAAYRREIFLDNGGFDAETFSTASVEDQEFSFRLAAGGHQLIFAPDAKVQHRHNSTLFKYFRRKYYIGYWKMRLLKQHPGKAVRDSHTPQIVKAQIVILAAALISLFGVFWPIGLPIAIGLWIIFGLSMLPLLIKIARRDPPVIFVAPIMIFVRALALGSGLLSGLLRFYLLPRDTA